jgi:hypothetical protein
VIIGTKGTMLLPHVGMPSLFPKKDFSEFKIKEVDGSNHWHEFVDAILGEGPMPSANFSYSGPLSETVLLGGIATRFPKQTLVWDSANLSFKGNPKATSLVSKSYRKGWAVKGLG